MTDELKPHWTNEEEFHTIVTESVRGQEWVEFAMKMVGHIEGYTLKQYKDAPNDILHKKNANYCMEQIKRYCDRWGENNARGMEDNLLSLLKIAHYACVAYFKYQKETGQHLDITVPAGTIFKGRLVTPTDKNYGKMLPEPPYYRCKKCQTIALPRIEDSGPHVKLFCPECLAYIKFVGKEELDNIMKALTEEE